MINGIVIHCSDTFHDMDTRAADIRRWHLERGWSDIGYHFVICRDGTVEEGRQLSVKGAHARGYNHYTGICMIGGKSKDGRQACNFTVKQWAALKDLVQGLQMDAKIPDENVIGHNEVSDKACPVFDVRSWMGGE